MDWILRPVVWFATASMLTTILHELTHAVVAYSLGVRSTLFNYLADLDLTAAQAASRAPALIGVSGPLACFALGVVAWLAFRRARGSAAELPLLYLSVFGVSTFFGNLMSTAFVGDFSAVAITWDWPVTARYALSLIGVLTVAAIHFLAGRELARWAPARAGRVIGVLGVIVLPMVLGTAGVILVNLPMPSASVFARVTESSFWFFAAAGAVVAGKDGDNDGEHQSLRWSDGVVALLAIIVVRLMVRGIPFVP